MSCVLALSDVPVSHRYARAVRSGASLSAATALVACLVAGAVWLDQRRAAPAESFGPAADALPSIEVVVQPRYSGLLDPALARGAPPATLSQDPLLGPNFESAAPVLAAVAPPQGNREAASPTPQVVAEASGGIPASGDSSPEAPMPLPRPPGLGSAVGAVPWRPAARQIERPARTPAMPAEAADSRTFIQKLFGIPQSLKSVMAYASPEDDQIGGGRISVASPPWTSDRATAVYNISAHTVTLPNGTVLEAHSGLGPRLDDPRYVSEPNRGATPPHTYDLELRSQLFHGVQALRLNPIGGGGVFGRTGLLAHTFMLGPNGDSNGCVSFRNYNAFLQAFMNGEVRRLVVVAGRY